MRKFSCHRSATLWLFPSLSLSLPLPLSLSLSLPLSLPLSFSLFLSLFHVNTSEHFLTCEQESVFYHSLFFSLKTLFLLLSHAWQISLTHSLSLLLSLISLPSNPLLYSWDRKHPCWKWEKVKRKEQRERERERERDWTKKGIFLLSLFSSMFAGFQGGSAFHAEKNPFRRICSSSTTYSQNCVHLVPNRVKFKVIDWFITNTNYNCSNYWYNYLASNWQRWRRRRRWLFWNSFTPSVLINFKTFAKCIFVWSSVL